MAVTIIQGENFKLKIRVSDKKSCKPWNFTGFTGATAAFPNADGSGGAYQVIGTNPETNLLEFDLQPSDTNSILQGDSIDFQYQWAQGGQIYIEQVQGQLNVLSQLFGL